MNNSYFEDCGILFEEESLREELRKVQSSYFSTTQKETVEGAEGTKSNCSDYERDGQTEISEGQLLNNTENDSSAESSVMSSFGDESTDPFSVSVKTFQERNCGCSYGRNKEPCSRSLCFEDIVEHRMQCVELTSGELDLVIMASIQSQTKTTSRKKRSRTNYFFKGEQVCRNTFQFLHGVGRERLSNLKKHLRENGLVARRHGNTSRLPHNVLSQDVLQHTVTFIKNFASEQGIALPGRVPQFKDFHVQLLPSSETKASMWRRYKDSVENDSVPTVSYSKFVDIWNTFTPYIIMMTPATDLCNTCQMNNSKIFKSVNIAEDEKKNLLEQQNKHITRAMKERDLYKDAVKRCKETLQKTEIDLLKEQPACSFTGTVHYSYDYAQQVHYPSNPQQPGPIYFKTPRKCGLFGICCEGLPRQINYLIDESVSTGKGANATISYVHDFFSTQGAGETDVHIHADNCGGQNKNNYVIWYYCWRVLCGFHHSILYSFLIAGHTKFSPDWCFGLLKQSFRRNFVSSLFDLMQTVDSSTVTGVNVSKLCGLHDGSVLVPVYDWASYLEPFFKKIPGISKYHHFRFSKGHPGVVFCREFVDSGETEFQILKDLCNKPPARPLPPIIHPAGLDETRKNYLFREIRPFCRPGTEELVAPKPADD